MSWPLSRQAAIAGVGYSPISRHTGLSELALCLIACKNALADAGLQPGDIDGIGATVYGGIDTVGVLDVSTALGVDAMTCVERQSGPHVRTRLPSGSGSRCNRR